MTIVAIIRSNLLRILVRCLENSLSDVRYRMMSTSSSSSNNAWPVDFFARLRPITVANFPTGHGFCDCYPRVAFLTNPSSLHSSEPTPLCTKNNPVGSYFFFTDASRA